MRGPDDPALGFPFSLRIALQPAETRVRSRSCQQKSDPLAPGHFVNLLASSLGCVDSFSKNSPLLQFKFPLNP